MLTVIFSYFIWTICHVVMLLQVLEYALDARMQQKNILGWGLIRRGRVTYLVAAKNVIRTDFLLLIKTSQYASNSGYIGIGNIYVLVFENSPKNVCQKQIRSIYLNDIQFRSTNSPWRLIRGWELILRMIFWVGTDWKGDSNMWAYLWTFCAVKAFI